MAGNRRRTSSDYLVTVNIQCATLCPSCNGRLSPFDVPRRTLRKNSKYLKRRLEAIERDTGSPSQISPLNDDNDSILSFNSQLELRHAGLGFSCRILESMLRTWRAGWYEPVQPPMRSFEQLKELSRALWHYECSPRPFMEFAETVLRRHWHPHTGKNARDWIFIAIVFDFRDVFGYSAMELAGFGAPNSLLPHPSADHFQIPYESSVPRFIIEPQNPNEPRVYSRHLTMAYNFVRTVHGRLDHSTDTESMAKRLKTHLGKQGVQVLLSELEPENDQFFRFTSPAALLRLLEDFLQTSLKDAQRRSRSQSLLPPSGRFGAKRRKAQVVSPEDAEVSLINSHLERVETWRRTHFGGMLKNYPSVESRFNDCRSRHLGATNTGHQLPELEMPSSRSLFEVQ